MPYHQCLVIAQDQLFMPLSKKLPISHPQNLFVKRKIIQKNLNIANILPEKLSEYI